MGKSLNLSKDTILDIIKLYLNGEDNKIIAKKYNISICSVRRIIKRNGYKTRSISESKRKYKVDFDYFEFINSPEKAYWLGFLYADGYVSDKYNIVVLNLCKKDKKHIKKFLNCLNSNYPITYGKNNGSFDGEYFYAKTVITSKKMVADLYTHGVDKYKTLRFQIKDVPDEYLPHFWRGFVDGDGMYYINPKGVLVVGATGNYETMENFSNLIFEVTGYLPKIFKNHSIYQIRIHGKKSIIFSKFLYKNATIYLDRKYKKIKDFINIKDAVKK